MAIGMKRARTLVAFIAISAVLQIVLLLSAAALRNEWMTLPIMPGLKAMTLLPADPQTAGSFIVFPTPAQAVLAFAVNTGVFALLAVTVRKLRHRPPGSPPQAPTGH